MTEQGKKVKLFQLRSEGFSWCADISLTNTARIYGAVISQNDMLVNVGDNIAFNDGESVKVHWSIVIMITLMITALFSLFLKPQYGELKACVKMKDNAAFCILQLFHAVDSASGEQVCNEMECPLLMKSTKLHAVSSNVILSPVSLVHNCVSCQLEKSRKKMRIEQEEISINKLTLKHDYKNDLYGVNIYCMHTVS